MTDTPDLDEEEPKKGSKLPLIIGLVLAIVGGAGGFFATQAGMLPFGGAPKEAAESEEPEVVVPTEEVAFVALDPMTVSLPPGSAQRMLRFSAQLDVAPANAAMVEKIKPRIVDILNGYLRALTVEDLQAPAALTTLRTQMLHRARVVAGEGVVRDLLIMEFVLN